MEKIKESFENIFSNWNIKLSEKILEKRERGSFYASGWFIKYCFGTENDRNYMDIYSDNRMTDPSQNRIYEDGTIKYLSHRRISIDFKYHKKKRKYTRELLLKQNNKKLLEFIFFWKTSKGILDEGCFSQWQESYFTINNIEYSCAEQFMMAYKADLFDDLETLEEIINETNPQKIKELGRKIKNFDENVWNNNKYNIVIHGNYLKFMQNENMKRILLDTKEKIIVEASPYDRIWGVGLSETDERIYNPNNWNGENLLGFALMEVRDSLRL